MTCGSAAFPASAGGRAGLSRSRPSLRRTASSRPEGRWARLEALESDPETGHLALGLPPGPSFARILRTVEDAWLEHRLTSKEEALAFVRARFLAPGAADDRECPPGPEDEPS